MTDEQLDNVICTIMREDGPDGHVDGHDVIVSFIHALLHGHGDAWVHSHYPDAVLD